MDYSDFINRVKSSYLGFIEPDDSLTWNSTFLPKSYTEYSTFDKLYYSEEDDKEAIKKMLNTRYGSRAATPACPKAKKVYYDEAAGVTVVLWTDSTKTIVRAAEGDKHDAYLGYCTALAKKIHGTNSALKRELDKVLVVTEKKEEKSENV